VPNCSFFPAIQFFLSEAKGRSLEDLDVTSAAPDDPAKNEERMPRNIDSNAARWALEFDGCGSEEDKTDVMAGQGEGVKPLGGGETAVCVFRDIDFCFNT